MKLKERKIILKFYHLKSKHTDQFGVYSFQLIEWKHTQLYIYAAAAYYFFMKYIIS